MISHGKASDSAYPPLPATDVYIQASDKATTITVVAQAMTLNKRVFTYSPISSFLLISRSMKTKHERQHDTVQHLRPQNDLHQAADRISSTSTPPATISSV